MTGKIIATGEEFEHYMDARNKYVAKRENGTDIVLAMMEDQLWDAAPGSDVEAGWNFIKDCIKYCRKEIAEEGRYTCSPFTDEYFVDPYVEFHEDDDDWMNYKDEETEEVE